MEGLSGEHASSILELGDICMTRTSKSVLKARHIFVIYCKVNGVRAGGNVLGLLSSEVLPARGGDQVLGMWLKN